MQCDALRAAGGAAEGGAAASGRLDPSTLRVLVVDSNPASRREITTLLQECSYQVTSKKNTKEVLETLAVHKRVERPLPFDMVLKEHEPPSSNACRLLREFAREDGLRAMPVVVFSRQDDRERVIECLRLGASDYLVKPLRQNELRHLWTRVWRQMTPATAVADALLAPRTSSQESEGTKCDDDDEPASNEGSAPGQEGCGSKEGNGNSGDKGDGSGNRYQSTGVVSANSPVGAHKRQDGSDKNGNGNGGSNGNGASTTLKPDRNGALLGTAEGGKPAPPPAGQAEGQGDHREEDSMDRKTIARPTAVRYAPNTEQLVGAKRTASEMVGSDAPGSLSAPAAARSTSPHAPGSTSCHMSEDTHHNSEGPISEQTAPRTLPPSFSPQFSNLPFLMQQGPRPPPQLSVPWPVGGGSTDCLPVGAPVVPQADNPPAPPWAGAAMMQYLMGPFGPAQAQLMMQIQMLAEKSGVPPQVLLQQVLADSSQLLGLMSNSSGSPPFQQQPPPQPQAGRSGRQPSVLPAFPNPGVQAGPGVPPMGEPPCPVGWKAGDMQQAGQQESARQRQNAIVAEMMRQQQQQAALIMQSLQLWGMMGPPGSLGQNPSGPWPSGSIPHAMFAPVMPPVSLPEPSVAVSPCGHVDTQSDFLGRKGKVNATDPRKKRRQDSLERFREKKKNLNSSNTIRYPGRRELAQLRPRSRGQFVSYKREDEPQETHTNGQSKPVEDPEDTADGGTSGERREGDAFAQNSEGEEMNAEEEVDGAQRQPGGQNVQASNGETTAQSSLSYSSSMPHQHYCMLPIGLPGMDPCLFTPFSKDRAISMADFRRVNNGSFCRNSSDSGSNCPDMQAADK